jgi:hypothetical protein
MGKIAEALRANLRELAQADARMLRELDGALPVAPDPKPGVAGALADGLDALSVPKLRALCKKQGLKRYSSLPKPAIIALLRGGEGPQPMSSPLNKNLLAPRLEGLEARLYRMEALLDRIAENLGITQ